jgi:N-acetylornithine carbamoyltransferase
VADLKTDLISLEEIGMNRVRVLLDLAARLKTRDFGRPLTGKSAALVFLNPSLRTRTSFEVAMARLGGHAVVLSPGSDAWKLEAEEGVVMDGGAAEHVKEAAGVLASMCDLIGVRAFPEMQSFAEDRQEKIHRAFARHSPVPVVNMESALSHPLQALADLLTLREKLGTLAGRKLLVTFAYHPKPLPIAVPRSALLAAAAAGMDVTLARPAGFELPEEDLEGVTVIDDPEEGYSGAHAVYAKSWASPAFYGRFEEEAPLREAARDWRVTVERMQRTAPDAPFLHCLPVRRNVVVDDAVLDGPRSAVIPQAENRLWTTMAVVLDLLGMA